MRSNARSLSSLIAVVLAALVLAAGTSTTFAQATSGAITGTVTLDKSPLPGVLVTATSPSLIGSRTAETDVNGKYTVAALPPGDYVVTFEVEGLAKQVRKATVSLGTPARADAQMTLSAESSITIVATTPTVETTEVQSNYTSETIRDLPMTRTFQSTAALAPGVTTNSPSANQLVISGAPASENLYLVNGAVINENIRSQIHNLFIEDAIQEQTVLTGAISAEYGRFTGGVVSAVTKSGGNEFSGSFRDSLTNDSWTAKTPLEGQPDPLSDINEVYEATLGGRILRDRLWFFTAGRYFDTSTQAFYFASPNEDPPSSIGYVFGQKEARYEVKLTGQVTPKHSIVGAYLSSETKDSNFCFVACYEPANIDASRTLPNDFVTAHYNGIISSSLLLEAGYSNKKFAFKGSGGDSSDFVHGTWAYDLNAGGFYGAPVFCGFCEPESRDNHNYTLKATYYLATKAAGTHNLVTGYDDFAEQRTANNYQSGSNFGLYVFNSPDRAADGTILPVISPGDWIIWFPLLESSQGSDIRTASVFANDKWDVNRHLSANVGARFDKNDVVDSGGHKTSDDSAFSPRLGLTWDVRGDGRLRLNAGYNRYVSHIQESIGGSGASPAGNPAYFIYEYRGNAITGVPTLDAFQQLYDWFQAEGGTDATDLIIGAGVPGVDTIIRDSLKSPNVDEWTLGFGSSISADAFVRVDFVNREFNDFYRVRVDTTTGKVTDSLGNVADLGFIENADSLDRTYRAAILQASYRPGKHLLLGGNYTYSETKGNFVGENSGSGPIADTSLQYPEYKAFAQNNPVGYLPQDQKHKGRLWATYDVPVGFGNLTLGLLERYDSGTPYSVLGTIDSSPYVDNPGYETPPTSVNYYFSKRGALRWDSALATDVSLNLDVPIRGLNLFVKGDVVNVFDDVAQTGGNVSVLTAQNSNCVQTIGDHAGEHCAEFNPFTETPVEGINYQRGPSFGRATIPTTLTTVGHYALPRTYRFAVGMRF